MPSQQLSPHGSVFGKQQSPRLPTHPIENFNTRRPHPGDGWRGSPCGPFPLAHLHRQHYTSVYLTPTFWGWDMLEVEASLGSGWVLPKPDPFQLHPSHDRKPYVFPVN